MGSQLQWLLANKNWLAFRGLALRLRFVSSLFHSTHTLRAIPAEVCRLKNNFVLAKRLYAERNTAWVTISGCHRNWRSVHSVRRSLPIRHRLCVQTRKPADKRPANGSTAKHTITTVTTCGRFRELPCLPLTFRLLISQIYLEHIGKRSKLKKQMLIASILACANFWIMSDLATRQAWRPPARTVDTLFGYIAHSIWLSFPLRSTFPDVIKVTGKIIEPSKIISLRLTQIIQSSARSG